MTTVSALVLAQNEEEFIAGCVSMLRWADQTVVLVSDATTDRTAEICRELGATVVVEHWQGFAAQRNRLAELATGEWLLYVDADERVTAQLADEIRSAVDGSTVAAFSLPTRNVFLGRPMTGGGWWPDRHYRLIRKSKFGRWSGQIHETPQVDGSLGQLKMPIIHLSHRSLSLMLAKTAEWSGIEAERRAASGKPVRVRSLFAAVGREVYFRLLRRRGWRDGMAGWIEVLYQSFSRFISTARAWEMQRSESLDQTYKRLDEHLRAGGTLETFK